MSEQTLASLLSETLTDDPEWAAYVRNLSPTTPLRQAVTEYVRVLSMRLAPTPRERRAAQRILAEMERKGFASVDEYIEAKDPREVNDGAHSGRRPTPRTGASTPQMTKGD